MTQVANTTFTAHPPERSVLSQLLRTPQKSEPNLMIYIFRGKRIRDIHIFYQHDVDHV